MRDNKYPLSLHLHNPVKINLDVSSDIYRRNYLELWKQSSERKDEWFNSMGIKITIASLQNTALVGTYGRLRNVLGY